MCTDKNHGGRRCPADNSDSRRMRRKAAALKNNLNSKTSHGSDSTTQTVPVTSLKTIEDFKNHAEELKKKVYASAPEGQTQSEYDAEIELEITAFGVALGEHAEKLAGFNHDKMRKTIQTLGEEIYSEASEKLRVLETEVDKAYENWNESLKGTRIAKMWGTLKQLTDEEKAELTPEQLAAGRAHLIAQKDFDKAVIAHRALDDEYDSRRNAIFTEANQKLTAAYQTIISQIRPVGGEVVVSDKSEGQAVGLIGETVTQHYPASWLEAHNELSKDEEVVFRITNMRPNYHPTEFSETEDDGIPKTAKSNPMLIIPLQIREPLEKIFGSSKQFTIRHWSGEELEASIFFREKEEIYDAAKHGQGINPTTPPEGQGWEFKPTLETASSPEASNLDTEEALLNFFTQKRWVRTVTSTKKQVKTLSLFDKETAKELQPANDFTPEYDKAIAYHEFAHRMEEVLPDEILPRQERAFLARRSGKTLDGTDYGNLVQLNFGGEFGHDGKFVSAYVGREYFQNKNYEVFSTGIESIYGGSLGGLVGNSSAAIKYDADHRGFTLGILATL